MNARKIPWVQLVTLGATGLLLVGAVAFPLVITEAVLSNFLRVLEVIAKLPV